MHRPCAHHVYRATSQPRGSHCIDVDNPSQNPGTTDGGPPHMDSGYGVQAARDAGMRSFGYCGGLTPASRLEGSGTVVFDDIRDLPGLLATAIH